MHALHINQHTSNEPLDLPMARRPVICCDFDGVIASWEDGTFSKPGNPIAGARDFLIRLSKIGKVVICTCRTNSELYDGQPVHELVKIVWDWFKKHDMALYVTSVYAGQGKPFAAVYIDDKAIHCCPERYDCAYETTLAIAEAMCGDGKALTSNGRE